MRAALDEAGLGPADVGAVYAAANGSVTSTASSRRPSRRSLAAVRWSPRRSRAPSAKAAWPAPRRLVAAVLAGRRGLVVPTVGLAQPDPSWPLWGGSSAGPAPLASPYVLVNSFASGGTTTASPADPRVLDSCRGAARVPPAGTACRSNRFPCRDASRWSPVAHAASAGHRRRARPARRRRRLLLSRTRRSGPRGRTRVGRRAAGPGRRRATSATRRRCSELAECRRGARPHRHPGQQRRHHARRLLMMMDRSWDDVLGSTSTGPSPARAPSSGACWCAVGTYHQRDLAERGGRCRARPTTRRRRPDSSASPGRSRASSRRRACSSMRCRPG